jgi:hypothetical protein
MHANDYQHVSRGGVGAPSPPPCWPWPSGPCKPSSASKAVKCRGEGWLQPAASLPPEAAFSPALCPLVGSGMFAIAGLHVTREPGHVCAVHTNVEPFDTIMSVVRLFPVRQRGRGRGRGRDVLSALCQHSRVCLHPPRHHPEISSLSTSYSIILSAQKRCAATILQLQGSRLR